MGRTKPYIKLDTDTQFDPKMQQVLLEHGKGWAWDTLMLFCALGDFYGTINRFDNGEMIHAQRLVGRRGKRFDEFITYLAEIGLISQTSLYEHDRIESPRSLKDGEARRKRKKWAAEASDKAAEKRRREREALYRDGNRGGYQ